MQIVDYIDKTRENNAYHNEYVGAISQEPKVRLSWCKMVLKKRKVQEDRTVPGSVSLSSAK